MYELSKETIMSIVKTLKEMDVRGFESNNRLVGLVVLFESMLNNPQPVNFAGESEVK